ncbi:MAG: beta-ketoacyl-ACP synthase III, partial [Proteobacteria bacterium]|nr:beta-ketoacyl-ACP synthase III [Pseudomonadota bacterium]
MTKQTTGTSITGFGVWHPPTVLDNVDLCIAFNEFVRRDNARHADAIAAGTRVALKESSPEFIVKASGIERRYVHDRTGLTDPERMCPNIPERPPEELAVQAEYAVHAARLALEVAGRTGADIDLVVCGASCLQRSYPAIAIEVQHAIGASGFGFDISLGCSSATAAL